MNIHNLEVVLLTKVIKLVNTFFGLLLLFCLSLKTRPVCEFEAEARCDVRQQDHWGHRMWRHIEVKREEITTKHPRTAYAMLCVSLIAIMNGPHINLHIFMKRHFFVKKWMKRIRTHGKIRQYRKNFSILPSLSSNLVLAMLCSTFLVCFQLRSYLSVMSVIVN